MKNIYSLCKDCSKISRDIAPAIRCKNCGSPRMISHAELTKLCVAHVDCDAFFASIEKRDNPDLASKPVIIGGGARGVVSTCCYIARQSAVRSAMPIHQAKRLCPDAVFITPNIEKYTKASKQIMTLMQELTPLVEPLSIDEAFLDMSGTQKTHKAYPAQMLVRFAKKIEKQVGVSISIGLSHNKFLAKMASDLDKPKGFAIIGEKETVDFLAPMPVSSIYGVGKVFTKTLNDDGFFTIKDLQHQNKHDLRARYGEIGARLAHLSKGQDTRSIITNTKAKSISNETTFLTNISDINSLSTKLLELCEKVSERLKAKNLTADTITLKLRSADFKLRTRAKHLYLPTQLSHVMYENAYRLLELEIDGTAFRLIGIGMSGLKISNAQDPKDLFEPKVAIKAAAERAIDKVRGRFGKSALIRGKLFTNNDTNIKDKRKKENNNELD